MSPRSSSVDRRAQSKRRPLTSTLTVAEYVAFARIAARRGKLPTPFATEIIRQKIADQELEPTQ